MGIVLAIATAILGAAEPGVVRVVRADELAPRLGLVDVLDARSEGEFRRGHVPGARRVDWRDWAEQRPSALGRLLGDARNWGRIAPGGPAVEQRLRRLGLSHAREVVIVGSPSGWGEEGRLAWSLLYWGADRVGLLDGGFDAWRHDRSRPVETGEARPPRAGDFRVRLRPWRRVTTAEVERVVSGEVRVAILDARTAEEFAGARLHREARGGRIPGAHLVPARALYADDGRYVDGDALRRLLPAELGPAPLAYCTGGVRSALLTVLLEARLGVPARNYDGSLWEWSADPRRPLVANGPEVRKISVP